jgi:hypothetical protein
MNSRNTTLITDEIFDQTKNSRGAVFEQGFIDPQRSVDSIALAQMLAQDEAARLGDGFTVCPVNKMRLNFDAAENWDCYLVSIKGFECQFHSYPTAQEFLFWIQAALPLLVLPGFYVGGWWYQNRFYLDISCAKHSLRVAEDFARENNQLFIFHPATKKEIPVSRTEYCLNPRGNI